jgi:hypothetical protein
MSLRKMHPDVRLAHDRIAGLIDLLNEICDQPGERQFIDREFVVGSLSQVLTHLRESVATRPCWCCNGSGCKVCHATGMLPLSVWLRRPVELEGPQCN